MLVTNRSSPTSWTRPPSAVGEGVPAVPVVLGHAVLDRHDRVAVDQAGPELHHLAGAEHLVLAGQVVGAVAVQLAGRRVEGDGDLLPRREAGGLDRLDQDRHGVLVAGQVRREAALVTHGRRQATVVQQAAQRVVRLGAPAQGLREARRADRHHHELLQVDRVVGVHPAVHHVHHRHRQHVGVRSADVAVERHVELVGGRLGHGEAHPEDGVGPETRLVVGAVEIAQQRVDRPLTEAVVALERRRRSRRSRTPPRRTPPCRRSGRRRRAARPPRARRSRRRSAPPPGRVPRWRGRRRPRPWGCPASRGSRGR